MHILKGPFWSMNFDLEEIILMSEQGRYRRGLMDEKPLVSILCITYNHGEFIAQALDSFLMQKVNFKFEIIVGEDCSDDGTLQIIQRYCNDYPELLTVVTSETNVGMSHNFLRTIKKARGKYVAICEGDDYWIDSSKLQRQIDALEENQDCDLSFHSAVFNNYFAGTETVVARYGDTDCLISLGKIVENRHGFIPTASCVLRKGAALQAIEYSIRNNTSIVDLYIFFFGALRGGAVYIDKVMSVYCHGVPGSYSERCHQDVDIQDKHKIEIVNRYCELNEFTNYKYNYSFHSYVLNLIFTPYIHLQYDKYPKVLSEYILYIKMVLIDEIFPLLFTGSEQYILIGTGTYSEWILKMFSQKIDYIVELNSAVDIKVEFKGEKVNTIKQITNIKDFRIIVCSYGYGINWCDELIHKYGVAQDMIVDLYACLANKKLLNSLVEVLG